MAFGGSVSEWEGYYEPEKNARLDPGAVYVIEEDGDVRASATVLPLEAFVDGRVVRLGGVAAVMAHPAYRRRGYAGELMRAALAAQRERGQHLSMLWPFAHAFYRRYGWELAGEAISYTLKPTDLPTSAEQARVRAYREGDLTELALLLEKEAVRHPLCVRRGERRWRQTLEGAGSNVEGTQAAVCEKDGRVEGYLLYRQRSGTGEPPRTLEVLEVVARGRDAWEALTSFMAAYDPDEYKVSLSTPRGKPLHPFLRSSYVKAEVSPEFMLRIVDVGGALGTLGREAEGPLTLEVTDDVVPENTGLYTVGVGSPGEVAPGAEAPERVALDVRQLAQLYSGYLPAERLARHGLVRPSSPRALELLGQLFPPGDPWVFPPDHF